MDITLEVHDRTVTCICSKNIDIYSEETIRNEIMHKLPLSREYDNFVLDISSVTYMDSTGIGMLIYYFHYMNKKGKSFTLKGVQEEIVRILERNKLDKFLTIL